MAGYVTVKGVVRGRTIELEHAPGLPDGQEVTVTVEPAQGAAPSPDAAADPSTRWAQDPPRIRKLPGVTGGHARVRDTRIPVWTLWRLRELGRTDPQLLEDYPSLTPQDLAAAWEYVGNNSAEIREAIAAQGRSPAHNA